MTNSPSRQPRRFDYQPAVRKAVPLLIGINGPSGCGKTYSALRLATGIQSVVGGDVAGIDSEANRMLHYADKFRFHHIPFGAPFSPADYQDVLEFAVKKGAKTVVLDSASHLHDGPGGVLEMHATELEEMGGGEKNNFRAWAKPKSELRKLINAITTGIEGTKEPLNLVICFRAKNKIKIERGAREAEKLGFVPIASEEFIYEFATNILLYPGSRGVPTWRSTFPGEDATIKLPDQFSDMFGARSQLSEEIGAKMARWATGGEAPTGSVNDRNAKLAADWIAFWEKRGIGVDKMLGVLGKAKVEHLDGQDFTTLTALAQKVKAKELTADQAFSSSAPPPDELEDEDEAARRATAPTAEEIAAHEREKANGTAATTGKGA